MDCFTFIAIVVFYYDMRNALNAMQSTVSGFNHISQENVFRVCDVPHPLKMKEAIEKCRIGEMAEAVDIVMKLWGAGYAATDIIQTLFRVTKSLEMPEYQKLEFIKEIGFTHMRIAEGLNTQ